MTINQAIYSVREGVRQYADDSSISNRYILFLLDSKRAAYLDAILRSSRSTKTVPEWAKQTICLTMEETSDAECGCTTEECTVLGSTQTIPKLIASPRISTGGKYSVPLDTVSWAKLIYSGNNQYSGDSIFAAINANDKVYLKSNNPLHKMIECVYVTGIFEDTSAAEEYNNTDGTSCLNKDADDYPLDRAGFDIIRVEVIKDIAISLGIPMDEINNAEDDAKGKAS